MTITLADLALDDHGEGRVLIYPTRIVYEGVLDTDGKGKWRVREGRPTVIDRETHTLLNYARKHLNEVKKIVRFPRWADGVAFNIGQLVHHAEFGTGTINGICGCVLTIAFCDQERRVDYKQVVTRVQAERQWEACYLRGANRRLEEGRWLWVVRSFCSRRGEWTAFLRKWGVARSSAHDLIERFLQERLWDSQHPSGYRTEGVPKLDERAMDRAGGQNAARERLVREEMAKREKGHAQKLTYWPLRIKLPDAVANDCRKKYNEGGTEAKEYWVRAAYRFVGREPESGADAA